MSGKSFIARVKKLSAEEKDNLIRKTEQDAASAGVEYYGCGQCVLGGLQRNFFGYVLACW